LRYKLYGKGNKMYLLKLLVIVVIEAMLQGPLFGQVNSDSSLVAYWSFNGNAIDASGKGNDGTVIGATPVFNRFANDSSAYSFDGVDDLIELGDVLDNDVAVLPFNISFWILKTEISGKWEGIFHSDDTANNIGIMLQISPNNQIRINYGDGKALAPWGRRSKYSSSSIPLNEWIHIVTIVKGATDMTIYFNSEDDGGRYEGSSGDMRHSSAPARIGVGAGAYMSGTLDELCIYNRALSASEVDSLFRGGIKTSVDTHASIHPGVFALSQNYPNPFNPTTTVEFSLPKSGHVTLTIFDIMGREVEILVDQPFAAGNYKVDWDAGGQESGMYFYRIQVGSDFTRTKKLILMK
jgi:hypothetical protein